MSAVDARSAAARVVGRVVRHGAFSNVVSRTETSGLNPSDRRVAIALAYDVLRYRAAIDRALTSASQRPLERIDPGLLDLLRVAVAELARADRPRAVTVDVVVEAAKGLDSRYGGFANGVLRAIARSDVTLDAPVPEWLRTELGRVFAPDEIEAFWQASLRTPRVGIFAQAEPPEGSEPVEGIPGARLLGEAGTVGAQIQDPASVAVGISVEARPGELVLDMAAAPGGKTRQLVSAGATVVAMDVHPRRVTDARRRVPEARWLIADGSRAPFADATFDAVLVDAPCTGLGTLRRRPEIADRVGPDDVRRLAQTGSQLLAEARRVTRPGGRIIYAVCTVTPSETVDVVADAGARIPADGLPGRPLGDGWLLAPHLGPTDGMFIARIDLG